MAELLNGDPSFFLPSNRIGKVPTIHRDKRSIIQTATMVKVLHGLNAPRKPDIVFASCPANRRKLDVAIHIGFDFTFAPPIFWGANCERQ